MTSPTGNESNKPWENNWNDAVKASPAPEPKEEKGILPWLMNWSSPPQRQYNNEAAPKGSKASKFETVFSALTTQESRNQHTDAQGNLVTSSKGAQGITQVLPKVGKDPGFGVEPLKDKSEAEYLRFGRDYLKAMLKEFGGDYEKALAAYNAGVGNVKRAITKGGEDWKNYLPKKEETLPYIEKILRKN